MHMSPLHTYVEHMDGTGKFILPSHIANWYILVFYMEDPNYIHFELIKQRTAECYVEAGACFVPASGFRSLPASHTVQGPGYGAGRSQG